MTALCVLYNTMILSIMKVAALEWNFVVLLGEQHIPRSHATSVIMAITVYNCFFFPFKIQSLHNGQQNELYSVYVLRQAT